MLSGLTGVTLFSAVCGRPTLRKTPTLRTTVSSPKRFAVSNWVWQKITLETSSCLGGLAAVPTVDVFRSVDGRRVPTHMWLQDDSVETIDPQPPVAPMDESDKAKQDRIVSFPHDVHVFFKISRKRVRERKKR